MPRFERIDQGVEAEPRAGRVRGHRAWIASLCLGLWGCGSSPFLALPEVEGAQTLVAFFRSPSGLEVSAHSVSAPVRFERPVTGNTELTLAFYAASLEELELEAGPVPAAPEAACLTGGFGEALALHQTLLEDREFTPLTEAPEHVARFRFERPCPCAELSWRTLPVVEGGPVASLAASGPGSIYYLTYGAHLAEVDLESGQERSSPLAVEPEFTDLCVSPSGAVYLAGLGGMFARFTHEGGFAPLPSFSADASVGPKRLECRQRDGRDEVLLLPNPGRALLRWDGTEWSTAHALSGMSVRTGNRGSLIARRDGGVVYAPEDGAEVVELDAELSWQRTSPWIRDLDLEAGPLGALADSLELSLTLLTRANFLFHRPSATSEWVGVAGQTGAITPAMTGLLPLRDGVLVFGQTGSVREVHPAVGLCPPVITLERLQLTEGVVMPDAETLVLTSDRESTGENALVVVEAVAF